MIVKLKFNFGKPTAAAAAAWRLPVSRQFARCVAVPVRPRQAPSPTQIGVCLTVWHSLRAGHWLVTVALASCECHCGFVGWWRFSRPVRRSAVVSETPVPKLRFRYRGLRDR